MESKFDYEALIDEIMQNLNIIKINEDMDKDKYSDLL